ncbi:FecR family protein [Niabella drilacis]|uniref:FecR family protein n=1 Tax=Niabella drilacis (strain DSM 25811 / CCM 8410 / CCUG 62505 / LMG 26954 / E90) TaxID=1285928 RepID=A0A1G7A9I0_NIADE|nr:FecR family protein [Niabella drilacis]SDE10695.1 FecR family protein [Niabella drilacis]
MPYYNDDMPGNRMNMLLQVAQLAAKARLGELTAEEAASLQSWLQEDKRHEGWWRSLQNDPYFLPELEAYERSRKGAPVALEALRKKLGAQGRPVTIPPRRRMYQWVRAACIAGLLLLAGFWAWRQWKPVAPRHVVKNEEVPAPQMNRAMITLADGTKVYLDRARSGQLALQGGIKVVKLADGQIAYLNPGEASLKNEVWNTLTNPRGSTAINMQLADGSHVWLNAGSAIRYPVAFVGNERRVELSGEGYFEVTKDPSKKFMVAANGMSTEVLGTHFNINAYGDEPRTTVTLLEGSVKVSQPRGQPVVIRPGQEVSGTTGGGSPLTVSAADMDKVVSWRSGLFNFNGVFLKEAMRQLERWYDIDVTYQPGVQDVELMGKMTKGVTLNGLMIVLRQLGVHYRLEGRNLVVMP